MMDGLGRFRMTGGINWISLGGAGEKGVAGRLTEVGASGLLTDRFPPPVPVFRFYAFVSLCVYVCPVLLA